MKLKSKKSALLMSFTSLLICFAMLVGSTFAWFTDTATTGVNKIVSGNLKVDIVGETGDTHLDTLNFTKAAGAEDEQLLWEPGCRYLTEGFRIANKGNLALKWKAQVNKDNIVNGKVVDTAKDGVSLLDVIDFYVVTKADDGTETAVAIENFTGKLAANVGKSETYYIKGVMQTTAGNDYQSLTLDGISITVYATQDTVENDSFDNQYDKDAPYETVKVSNEKELRTALFNAPTDGSGVKIVLQDDITLEMLYAAPNLPSSDVIQDYEVGDTLNRYKTGVHPTAEDPTHWNPLVINQTDEEKAAYGAYYHMSANDERIARLVVKANQDVVLDLNGHNLSKAARATHGDWSDVCTSLIGNYGTLSIIDSEGTGLITGSGMISCSGGVIHNYGGALTMNNCKVSGSDQGVYFGCDGSLTVKDSSFTECATGIKVSYKGTGTRTDRIENCVFTKCGCTTEMAGTSSYLADDSAAIKYKKSGTGTITLTLRSNTITGTLGDKGDTQFIGVTPVNE